MNPVSAPWAVLAPLLGTALGLGLHSLPQPPQWRRPSNLPCPCPPRTTA